MCREGAPKLSVTLTCGEKSVSADGRIKIPITTTVLYEAELMDRPITFHVFPCYAWNYKIHRRPCTSNDDHDWEIVEDDTMGFMILDDPDVRVHVTRDELFTTLSPGETWSIYMELTEAELCIFPHQMEEASTYVYRHMCKGFELDWWDWGGQQEHELTTVMLPCFRKGRVLEPKDNEGRPKIVVPASNALEFSIT